MNGSSETLRQTYFSNVANLTAGQRWTLVLLNMLLSITNVNLNAVVIFALWRTNQIRNIAMKLILMLSAYDLVIGLITNPLAAVSYGWFYEQEHYNIQIVFETFLIVFPHASGFTLTLIGYDRFIRIRFLHKHDQNIKLKKVKLLAFVIIPLFTILIGGLNVMGRIFSINEIVKLLILSIDILAASFILSLYFRTMSTSYTRTNNLKRAAYRSTSLNIDAVIIKTSSFILASVCIFYFPYVVASVLNRVYPTNREIMFNGYVSGTIVFANSSANAVIFILFNPKIKQWATSKFTKDAAPSKSIPFAISSASLITLEAWTVSAAEKLYGKTLVYS